VQRLEKLARQEQEAYLYNRQHLDQYQLAPRRLQRRLLVLLVLLPALACLADVRRPCSQTLLLLLPSCLSIQCHVLLLLLLLLPLMLMLDSCAPQAACGGCC
jgi:hypothetical protein